MPKAKKKAVKTLKKSSVRKKKPVKKVTAARSRKKVSHQPKGYNSITPYLIVNDGNKAINFYKKAFNAKVVMKMDRPDGKIAHAELKIGDAKIMVADECPSMGAHSPTNSNGTGVGIHLYIKNVDGVVKRAVSAGAKVIRPTENMFYGDRIAAVTDPYGHQWSIATHFEDVTQAQMRKRAAQLYGKK